jgi:hypothetical protein
VNDDLRPILLGMVIAVVAGLLLTVLAASLDSSVNGPGHRAIAEPVLWGLGGGAGLVLGSVVASWLTRRAGPGILVAVVGGVAVLVLLVVGYNSSDLRFGDQVVGTLVVVVLPEVLVASLAAVVAMLLARLVATLPRPH